MADEKQGDFDKKRPNYFQGMMLVDKDFRDEQTYHRQMRQNHNLGLHTWGVVRGLEVSLDAGGAVKDVTKGLAIDASGQEIWWGGGAPTVTGASTEGSYLVIKWKEEVTERYPQMPDKPLRFIDTASFSWESSATDNVVLAQIVEGKADNDARRNAASVRANGNDVELRPVTRDGALRLKTGGDHQDFCAGATDVEYGTAYAGFNVARIRVGGASKWSFGGDGNNSGGALIFGDIFGKLRFVTAGSPGSAQILDNQGILDRTRMTINQYGSVGIGTTDPKVLLHLKFPGGARGNAAVLNLEGTDHVYMQWYPAGFSEGRKGWIGYESANEKSLTIKNEYAGGHLNLFSASGKVGIGVPDPQSALDVKGDPFIRGGLWFANEQGRVYAEGWLGRWEDRKGGPSWMHLGGITEGGTRRLMLVADITTIGGNVGIGTPDPKVALHLKFTGGAGGNAPVLNLEGTDHVYMQWYPAGYSQTGRKGWIGYRAANEKNLTIQNEYADGHLNLFSASGKVGIGTDSPASTLHIRRDVSGSVGPTLLLHNGGGTQNAEARIDAQTYTQDVGPNFRLRVIDDGNFGAHVDFSTKPTGNNGGNALASRLYIKADGNVGIGTTDSLTDKLTVNGSVKVTGNISSPKWGVFQPINAVGPLPKSGTFRSGGGTLIIFASGSAWKDDPDPNHGTIGMDIDIDNVNVYQVRFWANENGSHKSFVPIAIVKPGLPAGDHTITFKAPVSGAARMFTDYNDRFHATILELPF
ncbi:MAG TPA: hypothetical protein VJ464_15510 [Blastocatellia bacterium]|nr:hypothetical protein [Blastocatellia bacterium]